MIDSIAPLVECLKGHSYQIVQYFPKNRALYFGRELLVISSFLVRNNPILFRASGIYKIYDQIMSKMYPKLHDLYRFFFRGEELDKEVLFKYFTQEDIDILIRNGILSFKDKGFLSNCKFVPVDNFIIVASPDKEYGTANYVYIGGDSILFRDLIKKENPPKVYDALEIGCGAGFLSLWMSQTAQNVTACDINQNALEFTSLNARINGVKNITIKYSDVYSNIDGKFDLIISNPPYVFLPEDFIDRTFAFGGHFGLKILEKILLGLDDHLKDNGKALIIARSYIKGNSVDTLYEMIKSIFDGKSYSITLRQIDYYRAKNHHSFYKQHGISHAINYFIKIEKNKRNQMTYIPIRGVKKFTEKLKIKFL